MLAIGAVAAGAQQRSGPSQRPQQSYALAVASFAPLNADVFIADADGRNERPFLPDRALDYNASFAPDGKWIVFTSTRSGSADIYRARPDGTNLEKLTNSPAFDDQGALSPDGRWLAFVSSRSGQADIWTLELKSGDLRNVTSSPRGDFRPQWSPDGEWIAFSSDRNSMQPKFTFVTVHSTELYVVRPDGTGLRRLTQDGRFAGSPQWSADGKYLFYYEAEIDEVQKIRSPLPAARDHSGREARRRGRSTAGADDRSGREVDAAPATFRSRWLRERRARRRARVLHRVDERHRAQRAGRARRVPEPELVARRPVDGVPSRRRHERMAARPAWPSLDPQFRLVRTGVFASYDATGARLVVNDQKAASLRNSVVLFNVDGSGRRVVFGNPERNALAPAFSPTGDRIAFGVGQFFQAAQGAATADIAVMLSVGGGEPELLTQGGGNFGFPSWSPDGKRIVYRAAGADHNGLYIVDVATKKVTTLMEGKTHVNFPKWSPRGDRIAFTADIDGDYEVYTVTPDGKDLKRVTNRPGNDAHNSWSPDGEWIAFTSEAGGFKDESPIHPYNPQPYGDIFVVRADGSDVRMLTDDQFEDGTPSWIPAVRWRSAIAEVPRIGYIGLRPINETAASMASITALKDGLRDLGYVEGKDYVLEVRIANNDPSRYPELTAELTKLQVKLIVAASTPAAVAIHKANPTMPIVLRGPDIVGRGIGQQCQPSRRGGYRH